MNFLKHISHFFFSLRTTLWLLGLSLVLMLAGAFIMPGSQEFQKLHSMPLIDWMQVQPPELTWWLWGLIAVFAVMAVNTLFCSAESLVKKGKVTKWLLLIAPQIIHLGFLFILLAHLLSGLGSSQQTAVGQEGTLIKLPRDNTVMKIDNINIYLDYSGYVTDWDVSVEYMLDGKVFQKDIIRPNQPSVQRGFNINVKDMRAYPEAVLLQINREPGAMWALAGGILFIAGIGILIVLKIRMER